MSGTPIVKHAETASETASEFWSGGQDLLRLARYLDDFLPGLKDQLVGGLVAEGVPINEARTAAVAIVGKLNGTSGGVDAAGKALCSFSTDLREKYIEPIQEIREQRKNMTGGLKVE